MFYAHLFDLSNKIYYCFLSFLLSTGWCYFYLTEIYFFCTKYLIQANKILIYTSIFEGIKIHFQLVFLISFFFVFPVFSYFFFLFFIKGLFNNQIMFICLIYYIINIQLILLIISFIYYLFPNLLYFCLQFEFNTGPILLEYDPRFDKYFLLFLQLFVLLFISVYFSYFCLIVMWIYKIKQIKYYLYLIFLILIIFFSPPDFSVQLLLIFSMYLNLEFTCLNYFFCYSLFDEGGIRTHDENPQQIYSLPPLTTQPPHQ